MRKDLPSLFYASGPLPPYDNLFLCLQAGRWDESLLPALSSLDKAFNHLRTCRYFVSKP